MNAKTRIRELLKMSRFSLKEKATELGLKNVESVGKVKLAVMIVVKEEEKEDLHYCKIRL